MSAGQVARVPSIGLVTPAKLFVLAAVFGIGVGAGLAAPRFISGPTADNQATTARSQAMEVTPALVSEPYLTIQHGIVVLPSSSVATPAFASMPAAARPGIAVQDFRGAQDFRAAQDSEQATRLGGP